MRKIDQSKLLRIQDKHDRHLDLLTGTFARFREAVTNAKQWHDTVLRTSWLDGAPSLEELIEAPKEELAKARVDVALARRALDEYARAARLFAQYETLKREFQPLAQLMGHLNNYAAGQA